MTKRFYGRHHAQGFYNAYTTYSFPSVAARAAWSATLNNDVNGYFESVKASDARQDDVRRSEDYRIIGTRVITVDDYDYEVGAYEFAL